MRRPLHLPVPLRGLLLLLLSLALWPRLGHGAAHQVQAVVLETRTEGDVPAEDRARVGDALWAALDRLGVRRSPDSDREAVLSGEPGLRACLSRDECLERLGRLLDSTHVIAVQLFRTAPTAFRLQVQLFDVDVGETGARIDWNCTACGIEEVARHLDRLIETAIEQDAERPRATLVIRSKPPNVDVLLDGRKVGFTEMERHVFAGVHEIVLSRPDLAIERTRIDVSGGQRLTLNMLPGPHVNTPPGAARGPATAGQGTGRDLADGRKGPGDAGEPPPSHWKLGLGIPLLVAGLGVAGLGTAGLVLDGSCTATPCTTVYKSGTAGTIEVGVGAAAAVTGIVLIAVDVHQHRKSRRSAAGSSQALVLPYFAPGGFGLSLAQRF